MATQATIDKWKTEVAEAGFDQLCTLEGGEPGVIVTCWRCGGGGEYSFNHKDGTMCYGCSGKGVNYKRLSTVVQKVRRARRAADPAVIAKKAAKKRAAKLAVISEAREFIAARAELQAAFAGRKHGTLRDIARQLVRKGCISEAQIALVIKLAGELDADAQNAATEVQAEPLPVTDERVKVVGEITAASWKSNDFGLTLKITVKSEDGWKVWGTCPSDFGEDESALVGRRVSFMARISPARDDDRFGFFKRPTQAQIDSAA